MTRKIKDQKKPVSHMVTFAVPLFLYMNHLSLGAASYFSTDSVRSSTHVVPT